MRIIPTILIGTMLTACTPAPATEPTPAPETPAAEATPPAPMPSPEPAIVGGYAPADLADETVKAAQTIATDAIYTRDPTRALVEKVEAEQQVVAGMNYRFVITMTGGAKFGVTVFRDLDGKMEVTEYAKLP
jgi:hypothetical protein